MLFIYAVHKNTETGVIEKVKYTRYFGYLENFETTKKK